MSSQDDQTDQRRKNLAELARLGVEIYPRRFDRRHAIAELVERYGSRNREELEGEKIDTVTSGRILTIRSFGKANFLVLFDGAAKLQVYVRQDALPPLDFETFRLLDFGDWIGVEGHLFRTKTNEFSVHATRIHFLAKCLLPLPEKWHGLTDLETRYRQRYLDLIVNPDSRRLFETRSRIVAAIRAFMTARGYLEVETPMMQPIAGGAIARPFVTHHNALDMDLYLRIAPELYLKRLTVGGLERVFEINRNFRNEGISTQHNPEFTMMEFYEAYADYQTLMTMTEEMIGAVAREATGTDQIVFGDHEISLAAPFARCNATCPLPSSAPAIRPRRWRPRSALKWRRPTAPARSPRQSSRRCARIGWCSRLLSTISRPKSRRCRSRSPTIPTPSSDSSCTSAGSRSRTRSAS
jgi:lysyl-tRNA synthetase class 2